MKTLRYFHCDVFTGSMFGGNQLAVVFDANNLDKETLQQIAREFNFSETTFILPARDGGDCRVRIFTPEREVPFAGHPNVGTAFVMAQQDMVAWHDNTAKLLFEEQAGRVSVDIKRYDSGHIITTVDAPEPLSVGNTLSKSLMAEALSLPENAISTRVHPPIVASVGLEFILVELSNSDALASAKVNVAGFENIQSEGVVPYVHMYVRDDTNPHTLDTRMFAPLDGIMEDPATGSANAALAAFLTDDAPEDNLSLEWHITQGRLMGRPSDLFVKTIKRDSEVVRTQLCGQCVMVASGEFMVT